MLKKLSIFLFFLLISSPSYAQANALDSGDTAWLLVASLLVLMMTVPGLALFYGGLVKRDNVLTTLMQAVGVCVVVSVVWPVIGYSLAFTEGNSFVGGLDKFLLSGVTSDSMTGTIPESVFITFQMTFAVITIALLFGAVADRIKFTSVLIFTPLWLILVYAPVAHWVWGPGGFIGGVDREGYEGFLGMGEALDFAGGTVVHINSGVAGLVAAIVLGRGMKTRRDPSTSNNLILSVIGTGLLWVGWFGFNAGSALSAGTSAGMAMLVTNAAAGIAALVWMLFEMFDKGKISVQGTLSGIVAGLVAITPAAGFVDFGGSLFIGGASGAICYLAVTHLKNILKYDDALDVFGLHGIGGIVGAVLVGVFANPDIGGAAGALYGNETRIFAQILSVVVTMAYSGVVTLILLMVVKTFFGLRVDPQVEYWGLDLAHHGETISEYTENLPDYYKKETTAKKKRPAKKAAKKKPSKK
ncbi:MAG: ammonium transporter [Alphaproteobacteria bacterium]|nr:ammonium transporter [Alphaproteobacteria bacterium]